MDLKTDVCGGLMYRTPWARMINMDAEACHFVGVAKVRYPSGRVLPLMYYVAVALSGRELYYAYEDVRQAKIVNGERSAEDFRSRIEQMGMFPRHTQRKGYRRIASVEWISPRTIRWMRVVGM